MSLVRIGRIVAVTGGIASWVVTGAVIARRSYRRWGATETEAREALPGDAVVADPMMSYTHAIDIDAALEDVWPWIAQLGVGRGGWYSYDWVDDVLGTKSLDRVVPELQELRVGDEVRQWSIAGGEPFRVARVEPRHLLLLQMKDTSWLFLLRETDDGATRLIVRTRSTRPGVGGRLLCTLAEPLSLFIERKMVREIKERAEKLAWSHMPVAERPVKPLEEPEASTTRA